MKFVISVICVFLLFGCTKDKRMTEIPETKKDTTAQQKQNTQSTTETKQPVKDTTTQPSTSLTNIEYGISKLPPELKDYKGKIVAMAKWEDKMGANILFITETEEKTTGDNRSKELFGYHFTVTDKENKQVWKINDFINDCPVDVTLNFIKKSITVTDIDKNGIAETSFLYRMSCKGDVSPDDMKLIMHEGETKYALRGQMKLTVAGEGSYGGEMKVDPSFDKAPKEFLDYAKGQWNKYVNEKAGE